MTASPLGNTDPVLDCISRICQLPANPFLLPAAQREAMRLLTSDGSATLIIDCGGNLADTIRITLQQGEPAIEAASANYLPSGQFTHGRTHGEPAEAAQVATAIAEFAPYFDQIAGWQPLAPQQ